MGAALPLTKTFAYAEGGYTTTPYPHVTRLTSFQAQVDTIDQFAHALRTHGAKAHCLFNGHLQRPLVDESRKQKTLKGVPRDWIVFDFDKVPLNDGESVVERYLPAYAHNVSYIEQVSASMFVPDQPYWSGHVFMLLKEPTLESQIVEYLEHLNFTIPALDELVSLSKAKMTLHWPLDRSAGHDSKLIYIAPPRCIGFEPAIQPQDAIRVVRKKKPALDIPSFKVIDRRDISDRVNRLRRDEDLDDIDLNTRRFGEHDVFIKTPASTIDSVRAVGDHYLKLNINGGDSWAYWIDLRNPELIHNFKGEPSLITKDVDEKFYKGLKAMAPAIVSRPPLEEGAEILAFYARNQNSQIKIGTFLPISRQLRIDSTTETAANAWLWSWGMPRKGPLDLFDITFEPANDHQYVPGTRVINMFRATDYMLQTPTSSKPSTIKELPARIDTLLRSLLGDPTEDELTHFINWFTFIFRKRRKATTAWVLHGTEGTGKGTFLKFLARPLLGADNVIEVQPRILDSDFNSHIDNKLLVWVDESSVSAVENRVSFMDKLGHYVTEETITIHAKGRDAVERPSFASFILAANRRDPVEKRGGDRRYNIARRQEKRLFINPNDYTAFQAGEDLEAFADVLLRWPLDEEQVRVLLDNEASQLVHESTVPIGDLIAERIKHGDIAFFIDHMPSDNESMNDFKHGLSPLSLYKKIVDDILARRKDVLTFEDLYVLFQTLIPDPRYFQSSRIWRGRYFKSLGLDTTKKVYSKVAVQSVRGFQVDWQIPPELEPPVPKTEKVVPLKKRKRP
jgi:hypothetical protein